MSRVVVSITRVKVNAKLSEPNFVGPHSIFLIPDWQLDSIIFRISQVCVQPHIVAEAEYCVFF